MQPDNHNTHNKNHSNSHETQQPQNLQHTSQCQISQHQNPQQHIHTKANKPNDIYTEMVFIPSDYYDVFVDYIVEITHNAIEEIFIEKKHLDGFYRYTAHHNAQPTSSEIDSMLSILDSTPISLTSPNNTHSHHTLESNDTHQRGTQAQTTIDFASNYSSKYSPTYDTRAIIIRSIHNPATTPLCAYASDSPAVLDSITDSTNPTNAPKSSTIDSSAKSATQSMSLLQALISFAHTIATRTADSLHLAYFIQTKPNHDWIARYQQAITPLECAQFYIHPSWHTPHPTKHNITIDPALAFGSGHHASTFMCIEMLSQMNLRGKACLDVGCGSGILGIIMAKQGGIVDACDVDSLAITETRKNFAQNGVRLHELWQGSIATDSPKSLLESTFSKVDSSSQQTKQASFFNEAQSTNTHKTYDVICANIVADVLACMRNDFIRALKTSGVLILSGILAEKYEWILEIFSDFTLLQKEQKDEWVSLKLTRIT